MAHIEGLTIIPRLLTLLASRSATQFNLADISRSVNLRYTTLRYYMTLLQTIFLVRLIPAWSSNTGSRMVKTPKVFINDSGLIAGLLGADDVRLQSDEGLLGAMLETFVVMEIEKSIEWSSVHPRLYHFRTSSRQEIDIALENPSGEIVGLEVKTSSSVTSLTSTDYELLQKLREIGLYRE